MKRSFLSATAQNPVISPDGTVLRNLVYLNQVIDHPNIDIGDYTYFNSFTPVDDWAGRIAPYLYEGAPERLIIGKFGQFANGTLFITSSANHPKRGFSSYPFAIFAPQSMERYAEENSRPGDTVIGNDVWLGHDVKIMPGVTLGNGVIVGAGAVVAHDMPAYSVVAGNPARVVRMRFERGVIAELERIQWWTWPIEKIEAYQNAIEGCDLKQLQLASET
ncbi:MAG TPA: CatB-related O-acetyltransferase [Aliiroseovarius sp.]|nr:CatB-related O-acetyltransferase [Aliiroseovarius sp.]